MAFFLFVLLLALTLVLFIIFAKRRRMRDAAKILIILGIVLPILMSVVSSSSSYNAPLLSRVIAYHSWSYFGLTRYDGPTLKVPMAIGICLAATGSIILAVCKRETQKTKAV